MCALARADTRPPTISTSHHPDDDADTYSILIVDDERAIVRFLHDLLESEGYRVHDAFDGEEAIDILRHTNPHLIISDMMMPRTNGRDLLQYIDGFPDESMPRVILMSASEQSATVPQVPFIEKPFDVEELLVLVDSTLDDCSTR
jgi:CheY-like chemotaxis protein